MIRTLPITILVEGIIATAYAAWRRKPVSSIVLSSIVANLVTQSLLWMVLHLFFQHYLPVLLVTEILIWVMEGLLLYAISANQLTFVDALSLSLGMNLLSFGLGWILPT